MNHLQFYFPINIGSTIYNFKCSREASKGERYFTGNIVQHAEGHMQSIVWKKTGSTVGPFYQAYISRVDTVFHSCPGRFFLVLQPIKIHMKYLPTRKVIFIDYGKAGTSHGAAYL
jgi:hypothetical protein